MTSATARQWQRVEYQVPVQLMVRMGGGADARDTQDTGVGFIDPGLNASRTLLAHAVNLSEGGISVRTSDPLPIGEAVTCSMLLEGKQTSLPGRVRWVKSTDEGLPEDAGIQFDALREDESGLLRHLVSRATGGDQPVEIYFPSMNEPVRARAMTSDGGLYITAALPVLTRDAEVEFQFGGEGPRFLGRIARVAVRERERTPHLEVELAIHAREMPRFRRYTMYGDPAREALEAETLRNEEAQSLRDAQAPSMRPSHAPEAPEAPALQEPAAATVNDAPQEPAPVLRMWDPKESPELPVENTTSSEALPQRAPGSRGEQAGAQLPRALLWTSFGLGAAVPFAFVAWLVLGQATQPMKATHAIANTEVTAHATPTPSSFGTEQGIVSARASTPVAAPAVAVPAATPIAETVVAPSTKTAATAIVPEVRVDKLSTDVLIPILGSGDDLHSTLWAAPLAVVAELPNASFAATERSYAVKAGGISRLMLTHNRVGAAVARVFLDATVAHHDVRIEGHQLVIHIDQDLAPAAAVTRAGTQRETESGPAGQ